jgi:hypothetical protein
MSPVISVLSLQMAAAYCTSISPPHVGQMNVGRHPACCKLLPSVIVPMTRIKSRDCSDAFVPILGDRCAAASREHFKELLCL